MRRHENPWAVTVLVAVAAVLATLLAVRIFGSGESSKAMAFSEMRADYMIGLVGPLRDPWVPLFLVDTKGQKVIVYDYEVAQRKFRLRAVRSFRYDRELEDYEATGKNRYKGPSVEDVRKILEREARRENRR